MSSLAPTSRNMGDDSSQSSGETCSSSSSGSSCSMHSHADPPTHIVTTESSSTAATSITDLVDLSPDEVVVDGDIVAELHVNDVLHGRGAAYDRMEGNMRFRALVKTRALVYRLGDSMEKKNIAQEIVSHVHSSGGRFLRVVDSISEAKELGVATGGEIVWVTVPPPVALEKVKQALRDSKWQEIATPRSGSDGSYLEMGGGLPSLLQLSEGQASRGAEAPHGASPSAATMALEGLAGLSSVATSLSHNAALMDLLRDQGLSAGRHLENHAGTSAAALTTAQLRQALELNRRGLLAETLGWDNQHGMSSLGSLAHANDTLDVRRLDRLRLLQQMERDEQEQAAAASATQRQWELLRQRQERAALVQTLRVRAASAAATAPPRAGLAAARLSSTDLLDANASSGMSSLSPSLMGKPFTGQSLLAMLQAQVLAETANDLPFLLKIQSVYRTVLQTPSNLRLTACERQSLADAVRSNQVAIARASTTATVATSSPAAEAITFAGRTSRSPIVATKTLPSDRLPRPPLPGASRTTAGASVISPSTSSLSSSSSTSGTAAMPIVVAGDSRSTYPKEILAQRAAIMADCAPTRRKRGYMNDANKQAAAMQAWRLLQQKRHKLNPR
jgi:hypothetical protein